MFILLGLNVSGHAHPAFGTVALVKVEPDGRVTVIVVHDAIAFALGEPSASIADEPMYELLHGSDAGLDAAFEDGRVRFETHFRLLADGRNVRWSLMQSPNAKAIRDWQREVTAARLPCKLDFVVSATFPSDAQAISIRLPEAFGDAVLFIDRPSEEPYSIPLFPGEVSPDVRVRLAAAMETQTTGELNESTSQKAETDITTPGAARVFSRYIRLGFLHIIPHGTDHALFVLGLFLLSPRVKSLLWQITAFTVAHTVTLSLTTLGLVHVSSDLVEPTIAGTIAFVAIENLVTTKVHPWRPAVAFVFGLVHGLGFASALSEVGLPPGQLMAGLAAFSIGVECGHLAVLAGAFVLFGAWRSRDWYRTCIAIPISLFIGVVALFWMVQRIAYPG